MIRNLRSHPFVPCLGKRSWLVFFALIAGLATPSQAAEPRPEAVLEQLGYHVVDAATRIDSTSDRPNEIVIDPEWASAAQVLTTQVSLQPLEPSFPLSGIEVATDFRVGDWPIAEIDTEVPLRTCLLLMDDDQHEIDRADMQFSLRVKAGTKTEIGTTLCLPEFKEPITGWGVYLVIGPGPTQHLPKELLHFEYFRVSKSGRP